MAWVAAIIVILLLVYSQSFRKVALVLVAVSALGIGAFYVETEQSKSVARSLIAASDLDFQDFILKSDFGYRIEGRIKNNSATYTLTAVGLHLSFDDCDTNTPPAHCVTIGETEERISVLIPAGQLREFSQYVFPGDTHPKGKLVWRYAIAYIEGK